MLEFLTLVTSTDASGDGTATDSVYRTARLLAVGLDYAATADAGTDVTISVVSPAGPALTLLSVTNNNTDGWYYPRGSAVTTANAAITDSHVELPFFGKLKLTVAQGGATVTDAVKATLYIET